MSEKVLAYIIVVGFTAPVCVLITWAFLGTPLKDIRRWYWRIRFRRTFGLWPAEGALEKKILQRIVDATLTQLARPYGERVEVENNLGAPYLTGASTSNPRGDFFIFRENKKELARFKRRFLGARETAKKHGFEVWDTEVYFARTRKEVGR